MTYDVDVAVVGAGTAGLSAVSQIRKQTNRWVLIEGGAFGTTCARVGCMPSKVFIQAAHDFYRRHKFSELGIQGAAGLEVSMPEVLKRVRRLRDEWVSGVVASGEHFSDKTQRAHAKIVGPHHIEIGDGKQISAGSIVLATGSTPVVPEPWRELRAKKRLVTTEEFFELDDVPKKVAVIGLGVIGSELGQALAMLGCEVLAVTAGSAIAGQSDPAVNEFAAKLLSRQMKVVRGEAALSLAKDATSVLVSVAGETHEVELVLASVGRRPNIAGLGLENLGVPLNGRGLPAFDRHTLQVLGTNVFIAGDMNSDLGILHEAADEGRIAGLNAMTSQVQAYRRRAPLSICFTEPNLCQVGSYYSDLPIEQTVIGEVTFNNQGRAKAMAQNEGVLRIYADKSNGKLLGAAIAAPRGEHLAHLLAWCLQQELDVYQMLQLPFYHPVIEEGLRTALRDTANQVGNKQGMYELALCTKDCTQILS